MDMVVTVDRMHLGLASQAAKGTRKNNPVMVFVERTAPEFFGAVVRFSKAFAVKQGLPIQGPVLRQ